MIVYLDTNFLLEMAFGQEQEIAAKEIMKLAVDGKIELVCPCFVLIEPYWTIKNRDSNRKQLLKSIELELQQQQRSPNNSIEIGNLTNAHVSITNIGIKEGNAYSDILNKVLEIGTFIDITKDTFISSLTYSSSYGLGPQDALIYSAIIRDMKKQSSGALKCFLSRNSKDFDIDALKRELSEYNCRYFTNFEHGLWYINSQI